MKIFLSELRKLKRSSIILPLLIVPLISVIFGSLNFVFNREILTREWVSLITQVYLFYGLFFMPALIGIMCSYSWGLEHKRNNMKLILSSKTSFVKIVLAKTAVVFCIYAISQLYLFILYLIAGTLFSFSSPLPLELVGLYIVSSLVAGYLVCMQSYISLKIKSFTIPIVIAVGFSFLSILIAQNNVVTALKYVFSNVSVVLNMNAFPDTDLSQVDLIIMLIMSALVSAIFIGLQVRELKRRVR